MQGSVYGAERHYFILLTTDIWTKFTWETEKYRRVKLVFNTSTLPKQIKVVLSRLIQRVNWSLIHSDLWRKVSQEKVNIMKGHHMVYVIHPDLDV